MKNTPKGACSLEGCYGFKSHKVIIIIKNLFVVSTSNKHCKNLCSATRKIYLILKLLLSEISVSKLCIFNQEYLETLIDYRKTLKI